MWDFSPTRNKANLVQHSGLVHGDLDHLVEVQAVKRTLCADESMAYCFVSPSGDGLKLGVCVAPVPDDAAYKHAWQAVANYYAQQYGVVWDPSGKDVSRLCFFSWDPALHINPAARLFLVSPMPPEASRPSAAQTFRGPLPGNQRAYYARQALDTATRMIDASTLGNRRHARTKAAYLLGGYVAGGLLSAEEARARLATAVSRNTAHFEQSMQTVEACLAAGMQAAICLEALEQERQAWLARLFYQAEDKSPSAQAVQDTLGVPEGKACFDGPEIPVYVRLAEHQGAIYLDLANIQWQAVEVTSSGWRIVDTPPVKFRRARGMLPLPLPAQGRSLHTLRDFVNIASDDDWRLVVSWLLAAFRPTGPYPVLVVHGEQGSAKSTLVRVLRSLVDPNTAELRTTPRDKRDLVIAANNGWLMALDNLSHLPDWLSDALCRLATGSGFATRALYTDAEEAIFAAQRPIAVNGIEELATRGDLLDRAVLVYLPTIPEAKRQDQQAFWRQFEEARPTMVGALLEAVSSALKHLPSVQLDKLPRMADFALWSCAAAPACGWTAQDFLDAYAGVRETSHALTLEASPVGLLVRDFVTQRQDWSGTASELLAALEAFVDGSLAPDAARAGSDVPKQKAWPKNGRALSNALRGAVS